MFDRETLEVLALDSVCACRYYDLADYLTETPNGELLAIIEGRSQCHRCNGRF
jgi:hypothetical protein